MVASETGKEPHMKLIDQHFLAGGLILEYSVTGEGTPVFVFHGGHSNCHEEFGYDELLAQGYSIITPSRAGYGRTSPKIGDNLKAACSAYADLLNHLEIDQVHVIAVSAGGPTGIYFASHYPWRVKSLTFQSAVSKKWLIFEDKEYKAARVLFRPAMEKVTWHLLALMSNLFPKFIFKQMAPSFSNLSYSEVLAYSSDEDISAVQKMNNRQRSGHGFMIDLSQTSHVSHFDLQAIRCPTLILHSKHDRTVPIEHAYHLHRHISRFRLCTLDTWGHLIWLGTGSEQMNETLSNFLKNNL